MCKYCNNPLPEKVERLGFCSGSCYAKNRRLDPAVRRREDDRKDYNREVMRRAKDKPCQDCGIKYPAYVMDFDHVRGDKVRKVSGLTNGSTSVILAEIAKCDVVCANCHRQRTFERGYSNDPRNLRNLELGECESKSYLPVTTEIVL